jgi:hypothetical protein
MSRTNGKPSNRRDWQRRGCEMLACEASAWTGTDGAAYATAKRQSIICEIANMPA